MNLGVEELEDVAQLRDPWCAPGATLEHPLDVVEAEALDDIPRSSDLRYASEA